MPSEVTITLRVGVARGSGRRRGLKCFSPRTSRRSARGQERREREAGRRSPRVRSFQRESLAEAERRWAVRGAGRGVIGAGAVKRPRGQGPRKQYSELVSPEAAGGHQRVFCKVTGSNALSFLQRSSHVPSLSPRKAVQDDLRKFLESKQNPW